MTGIYKIESPSGKVYIGQSIDIKKRWTSHRCCSNKSKLTNSIKKYGADGHIFSIIHELPTDITPDILTTYEQLYMDAYRSAGIDLMNLREAGSRGAFSEETRKLIGEKGKGRQVSLKHRLALAKLHKGHKYNVGRKQTEEWKKNRSKAMKGVIFTVEHRKKISDAKKGGNCHMYGIEPGKHPQARRVIDSVTGMIFNTVKEAAQYMGMKRTTLVMQMRGKNKNKTTLNYDLK